MKKTPTTPAGSSPSPDRAIGSSAGPRRVDHDPLDSLKAPAKGLGSGKLGALLLAKCFLCQHGHHNLMASTAALLCVLENTLDPSLAARAADDLGPDMLNVSPSVAFPGPWVLKRSRGPTPIAAYVIAHCTDPDVLHTVCSKDHRRAVVAALLENHHLSPTDRQTLRARITQPSGSYLSLLASQPVPFSFQQRLEHLASSHVRSARHLARSNAYSDLVRLLRTNLTPDSVDAALRTFSSLRYLQVLSSYLASHYRTPRGTDHDVWDLATITPAQLFAPLPPDVRAAQLTSLLSSAASWPAPARPLDLDIVKLIVSHVHPGHIMGFAPDRCPLNDAFTPDALNYLFADPERIRAFSHVLITQQLSPEQARTLVAYLDQDHPELAEEFFAMRRCALELMDPARVTDTLSGQTPLPNAVSEQARSPLYRVRFTPRLMASALLAARDSRYGGGFLISWFLDCITDHHDPLIARMLERATPEDMADYLTGGMLLRDDTQLLPPVGSVREMVSRIPHDVLLRARHVNVLPSTPQSYLEALADFFPGAAFRMLSHPRLSHYVFTRLSAAAPDVNAALSMFDALEHSTLTSVATTLAALNRAASPDLACV